VGQVRPSARSRVGLYADGPTLGISAPLYADGPALGIGFFFLRFLFTFCYCYHTVTLTCHYSEITSTAMPLCAYGHIAPMRYTKSTLTVSHRAFQFLLCKLQYVSQPNSRKGAT
jgi:hypothetical protein